jgi:Protein of unknown function (DUF998)
MTQPARPDLERSRSGQDHARGGPAAVAINPLPTVRSYSQPLTCPPVCGWAAGAALLVPVVLVGGWLAADALQPASYSPMRQTMSVLAGEAGADRWLMTAALLVVGSCQIATGAGLTNLRRPARILLVLAGLSTLGIAATPEPATGPSARHLAFAVSGLVIMSVWPLFVPRRGRVRPWILSVYGCATATAVFAALSCWLLIAARGGAGDLGLVERLTSGLQSLFPLLVVLALRQAERTVGNQLGYAVASVSRPWSTLRPWPVRLRWTRMSPRSRSRRAHRCCRCPS